MEINPRSKDDDLTARLRRGFGGMVPPICDEAANEIEAMRDTIRTANQALLEVNHAQRNGSDWYTRGASGLYQQVATWVKRGLDATGKHVKQEWAA